MPKGLRESEKLEKPIWTPSTKAEQGEHDENISREKAQEIVGVEVARKVEEASLRVYGLVSCFLFLFLSFFRLFRVFLFFCLWEGNFPSMMITINIPLLPLPQKGQRKKPIKKNKLTPSPQPGPRLRRIPRHNHRRHQIRIRPRPHQLRNRSHRRSSHTRQFALLAQRRLSSGTRTVELR